MIYPISLEVVEVAKTASAEFEGAKPEAQAHIRLAVDALLKAKSHLQTASRIQGEERARVA